VPWSALGPEKIVWHSLQLFPAVPKSVNALAFGDHAASAARAKTQIITVDNLFMNSLLQRFIEMIGTFLLIKNKPPRYKIPRIHLLS
jgi:hypothetical protein